MGDAFGGAESGTQLLARLEGRSSLKNLEPCLFAEEGSPVHGRPSGLTSQHPAHFQVHQGSEISLQPKPPEITNLSRLLQDLLAGLPPPRR
ncbi:DNA repair protein XRCC2 isoform X2 [Serinus canaria]|uniref:DNA repair protein XRCC2 isoform X2 n=1 Tax=Serinus canaria TaxID=9135 RepID=UPI0008DB7273|nr:DNA repair protein XRCC2 isoform X2 [Serinus canaria]